MNEPGRAPTPRPADPRRKGPPGRRMETDSPPAPPPSGPMPPVAVGVPVAVVFGVSPAPSTASPRLCAILLLVQFATGGPLKWPAAAWIAGLTLFPPTLRPWLEPLSPWAQTLHDLPVIRWAVGCLAVTS